MEKEKNKNVITLVTSNTSDDESDLYHETVTNYLKRYKEIANDEHESNGASITMWYEDAMDPSTLTMSINSEDIPLLHYMCSKVLRHLEDIDLDPFTEYDFEPE